MSHIQFQVSLDVNHQRGRLHAGGKACQNARDDLSVVNVFMPFDQHITHVIADLDVATAKMTMDVRIYQKECFQRIGPKINEKLGLWLF
jgi:hypothetical protein